MDHPEYMKVLYKYFPGNIYLHYNVDALVHNNFIYIKIKYGMYGLKQVTVLIYNYPSESLSKGGYNPIIGLMDLWKHCSRNILFNLYIDNFGINK